MSSDRHRPERRGRAGSTGPAARAADAAPDSHDGVRRSSAAVGSIFKRAREAQRLSQAEVAALTSGRPGQISRAMVSLIERGRHLPGLEATVALSRALHIDPQEIIERLELATTSVDELDGFDLDQLRERARDAFWAGEFRRAISIHDRLLQSLQARPVDDPQARAATVARIEIDRAAALRHCGALGASRASAERAVSLTEERPDLQARAYIVLASLYEQRGLQPLARDMAARAVELAERCDSKLQGMAWLEMGAILHQWRRFDEARDAFTRAGEHVRAAGDRKHEIHVEGNIGACLKGLGRHDLARQQFQRAMTLARRYEVPAAEAFWLIELGKLALERDDPTEAERFGREASTLARRQSHALSLFRAELVRHRAACARDGLRPGSSAAGANGERHRLAHLRRLYGTLRDQRGVEEIHWYRRRILRAGGRTGAET